MQDITLQLLQKFLNELASTSPGKGASLIGVEDALGKYAGSNAEAILQEIAAAGGSLLADSVETSWTGSVTGNLVLNHDLNAMPRFAWVAFARNDNSDSDAWSEGFWQDNAYGSFACAKAARGASIYSVHDSYMAIASEGGIYPTNTYVRSTIVAKSISTVTISRDKLGTYFDTKPLRLKMMLFA